jgi:hypothetical protein
VPYAHRPLGFLWQLPPALLGPKSLNTYRVTHVAYISLYGFLTFLLCRRLAPDRFLLAFLAGVFAAAWAPSDLLRLNVINSMGYSGLTMATFAAIVLFLESFRRGPVLLALAGFMAFIASRTAEAPLPLLAAAPLLVLVITPKWSRRTWVGIASWAVILFVDVILIFLSFAFSRGQGSYQTSSLGGLDLAPLHLLRRLLALYTYHLAPLASAPRELAAAAAPIAVGVFLIAYALACLRAPKEGDRSLPALMAVGLILAGLGYSPFVLPQRLVLADRTEFLSAPGIGIFLSAGIFFIGSLFPQRYRRVLVAGLAAWVIGVGTARVLVLQREWDLTRSAYPFQHRALVELTREVPGLKPHTLVVLIDDARGWLATFTFRHAVQYLYPGEATGYVWGASDFLYPTYFTEAGVYCVPYAVIQGPWRSPPSLHRYDEIVVVHNTLASGLHVAEAWPATTLPPLPAGALYEPWKRIVTGEPVPSERTILDP